jgi:hypothetical protein
MWSNWENDREKRAETFKNILKKAKKRKAQYDVLVPFSGGKDSTYVLYLATQVYNLKTLAYTFDNGFQSEAAKDNIRNAIDASGADHYFFRMDKKKLMTLYKHFMKHTGLYCSVCMRGISLGRIVAHRKFKIPLILRGTSIRTEEWPTPEIFQASDAGFFKNVIKKHPVNFNVKDFYIDRNNWEKLCLGVYLLSGKRFYIGGVMDIQLPDYVDWDYDVMMKTIKKEFNWRHEPKRDEHGDCIVDPVMHYIRRTKVPELTTNTLRWSAMIRAGMMTRDKALKLIEEEREEEKVPPKEIEYFKNALNISSKEFKAWTDYSIRFRHMEFQKESWAMKVFNSLRKDSG